MINTNFNILYILLYPLKYRFITIRIWKHSCSNYEGDITTRENNLSEDFYAFRMEGSKEKTEKCYKDYDIYRYVIT